MLRRLLLVLSTLAVALSVQSRPAAPAADEHHAVHARSKSSEPYTPVIVPVGEPAMLLGRAYHAAVKREPSPLVIMSPAFETSIGQPKGERPPAPVPTPSKRTLMPRYVAQRDVNYLSNVRPGPVYPSYLPYDAPHSDAPAPTPATSSTAAPGATAGAKLHSENVKIAKKDKARAKELKKHKSG